MTTILLRSVLGEDSHRVRTIDPRDAATAAKRLFGSTAGRLAKANVYYLRGEPVRLKPTEFAKGLKRYLKLHKFLLCRRSRMYDKIDYGYYAEDPVNRLPAFQPAYVGVLELRGKKAVVSETHRSLSPKMPPMTITPDGDGGWAWISGITPLRQCPRCGRYWSRGHTCNERRSAFYYHAVEKSGRKMWQHVPFKCPAQPPQARHLFVTYDIETYTIFENKGKRMHPFMLCFMLSGHERLVADAKRLALEDIYVKESAGGYYWIDKRPGWVARRFRDFRTRLQTHFARDLVRRFCDHNKEYCRRAMSEGGYSDVFEIPYELFSKPVAPLKLPEDFYVVDIIVLGHNICKFDELLLATELVERRDLFPPAGRCERSFMPRVGRLLFNDIHFHMPNPNYAKKDPTRTERWTRGVVESRDMKNVSVRFMVRDTLQLTSGAKLKKAAQAYALDLSKGECPYEAVNEFLSTGDYERDEDGFPAERYWEDPSVLTEQKLLWRKEHAEEPYDLIIACLEYCMQDVKVTQKLAHTLYENYDKYFREELGMQGRYNIFEKPTIPSNTHAFWKQLTFTEFAKEVEAAASSTVSARQGARVRKQASHEYVAMLYAPYRPMFKYIRQALRGGRCYPNVLGPYHKPVYVFDICGMYASALTHPMPHGMPLDPFFTSRHVDELNALMRRETKISYFDPRIKPSILKIEAYPPPADMLDTLPPLCSRRGGRLVWTNEPLYDEVVTVVDILTLHNRGWKVTALQDEMNIVFPEWKTICSEYVSKNIAAKEKADKDKNEVMRSISKMLSNALYGAFATNMDTTRVVFEQDLTDDDKEAIYLGTQVVKHVTLLNDDSFSGITVNPEPAEKAFSSSVIARTFNSPWSDHETEVNAYPDERASKSENALTATAPLTEVDSEVERALHAAPFIADDADGHAHYARANETRFKPMRLLDATGEAVTVLHLESLDQMVENKRYATQIACFVLGWSRAFFSEWCQILHDPDRGIHPHDREPQNLYGDTDSMFVTESGYKRMKERGAHRIKTPHTKLTFDPDKPDLYWACDCDIKCKRCGADTFSSESVFLAPKLYGLKDAVCTNPQCGYVGTGKIRSKGHRQAELVYDTLMQCWTRHEDETYAGRSVIPELRTSRNIFKTTLLNKTGRYEPFTIHNEPLTRVLRPWNDVTLYEHNGFLYPYDTAHPNPRTATDVRYVEDIGHRNPLEPLAFSDQRVVEWRETHRHTIRNDERGFSKRKSTTLREVSTNASPNGIAEP
ncbi:DNA polymerase [Aviadenovirus phalacrocoracidae]|uniref:DNA polymerase n=1 Tax=Aviadenovirus sp. TaxID=2217649 RepID=A0ABZ0T1K5_9ADEN|nr:DNA polymerase [Aviadenovirus sp.]